MTQETKAQDANAQDTNEKFFGRADAFIEAANKLVQANEPGRVGASMLFAAARFSSWLAAGRFQSAERMRQGKDEAMKHFVEQFQQMLNDNIEDHIRQFERQAQAKK